MNYRFALLLLRVNLEQFCVHYDDDDDDDDDDEIPVGIVSGK